MLLNALRAASIGLFLPWRGPWVASVDADLDATRTAPTGRAALTIGNTPLAGTVDPDGAGVFGDVFRGRILAGGGGWSRTVPGYHYHEDTSLLSTQIFSTTAAAVGETVVDAAPTRMGVDYVRPEAPASSVLEGLEWHVTLAGVTFVGPRPPVTPPTSLEILSWHPEAQRAEVACDEIIQPGTVLTDSRFGSAVVRDVEQRFDDAGARATLWCSERSASRVVDALAALVRAKSGSQLLGAYRYRVVKQGPDKRIELQAVDKSPGLPDLLQISPWYGVPGVSATLRPSSEVIVEFIGGHRHRPIVTQFDGATPLTLQVDAASILLGAGATQALALAPALAAWAAGVVSACAAHSPPITIPPLPASFAATKTKGV